VRKFSRKSRKPVSDDSQAKRSDLFAKVRYKSLPLITKINPVNPRDKDKPNKSYLQATKRPLDAGLIPLRSKTKSQKSKQKD
jgi:hypothetical protein